MADNKDKAQGQGMKIVLLALVALVLMAGVGVGAYLLGNQQGVSNAAVVEATDPAPSNAGLGPMVEMADFIVNILDQQNTRYLKASITLEVSNEEVAEELGKRDPQIRDAVLLHLGSKTFDEVRDLQGKLQLRAELVGRINGFLTRGKVRKIYFTDFVVQ